MQLPKINRRKFLYGLVGMTILSYFPKIGFTSIQQDLQIIAGKLSKDTLSQTTRIFVISDDQEILINTTPKSSFSRGFGLIKDVNEYFSNDEVVAEGVWQGDAFVANNLSTLYRSFEGTIMNIKGNKLEMSNGLFEISEYTDFIVTGSNLPTTIDESMINKSATILAWYTGVSDNFVVAKFKI